jgi:hypothetical protein
VRSFNLTVSNILGDEALKATWFVIFISP